MMPSHSRDLDHMESRIEQLERAVLAMVHVCEALICCAEPEAAVQIERARVLIAQARAIVPVRH